MLIILLGILIIFALALFFLSHFTGKPVLGIIGAIVCIVLAIWVVVEGVQIETGKSIVSVMIPMITAPLLKEFYPRKCDRYRYE